MKSLQLLHLATLTIPIVAQNPLCPDPPSNGCTNGMFVEESCSCVCITPFCHDTMGDCTIPNGSCPSQQLSPTCTSGVDCPWWVNTLKGESCITGNVVRVNLCAVFVCHFCCWRCDFIVIHLALCLVAITSSFLIHGE